MRVEPIGGVRTKIDPKAIARMLDATSDLEVGHYTTYACIVEEEDGDENFPVGHICSILVELTQPVGACEHCAVAEEEEREARMASVEDEVRERALGILT
jgi:hypothetical protein